MYFFSPTKTFNYIITIEIYMILKQKMFFKKILRMLIKKIELTN